MVRKIGTAVKHIKFASKFTAVERQAILAATSPAQIKTLIKKPNISDASAKAYQRNIRSAINEITQTPKSHLSRMEKEFKIPKSAQGVDRLKEFERYNTPKPPVPPIPPTLPHLLIQGQPFTHGFPFRNSPNIEQWVQPLSGYSVTDKIKMMDAAVSQVSGMVRDEWRVQVHVITMSGTQYWEGTKYTRDMDYLRVMWDDVLGALMGKSTKPGSPEQDMMVDGINRGYDPIKDIEYMVRRKP